MNTTEALHHLALEKAKTFRESQSELIDILLRVEDAKVHFKMGYTSMFTYAHLALSLSEAQAYAMVAVARTSRVIPEMKALLQDGSLNLSNARRLVSVIVPENKLEWLEKATTLSQRELEREVVKAKPELAQASRPSLQLEQKLKRVRDLLAQKHRRNVTSHEALELMADDFLLHHDPVQKAARARKPCPGIKPSKTTRHIPAEVKHAVNLRDGHRCAFIHPDKSRCRSERWVELHHVKPWSHGGKHTAHNLSTLCQRHHAFLHDRADRAARQSVT